MSNQRPAWLGDVEKLHMLYLYAIREGLRDNEALAIDIFGLKSGIFVNALKTMDAEQVFELGKSLGTTPFFEVCEGSALNLLATTVKSGGGEDLVKIAAASHASALRASSGSKRLTAVAAVTKSQERT